MAAPRRRLRRPQQTHLLQSWKAPRWILLDVVFIVVFVLLVERGTAAAPLSSSSNSERRDDVAPLGPEHYKDEHYNGVLRRHRRVGSRADVLEGSVVVDPRIIGGTPTDGQEYPFFVQADTAESGFYCGGSLIAPDVVLSAAHCAGMYLI